MDNNSTPPSSLKHELQDGSFGSNETKYVPGSSSGTGGSSEQRIRRERTEDSNEPPEASAGSSRQDPRVPIPKPADQREVFATFLCTVDKKYIGLSLKYWRVFEIGQTQAPRRDGTAILTMELNTQRKAGTVEQLKQRFGEMREAEYEVRSTIQGVTPENEHIAALKHVAGCFAEGNGCEVLLPPDDPDWNRFLWVSLKGTGTPIQWTEVVHAT